MADSAIAVGASTVEVPVSGGSGGTATNAGRLACGADGGHSTSMISVAPIKATTTTSAPRTMVRIRIAASSPFRV